jgi:uncharacterized protein YecT (DUF1311 family)
MISTTSRLRLLLLALSASLSIGVAHSAVSGSDYQACLETENIGKMRLCLAESLKQNRQEMERIVEILGEKLGPHESVALQSAQNLWEKFGEADCKSAGLEYEGGDLELITVQVCWSRLILARIDQLIQRYSQRIPNL